MTRRHSMSVASRVALLLVATTSIGTEQSQKAPGRAGPAARGSTDILSSLAKGQSSEIGDTAENRIDLGGVFFGFIDMGCSLHDTKKSLDPKRLTDYFLEKDPSTMLLDISVFKLNRMYQPTLLAVEGNGGCDSAVVQRMMSNLADLFNDRMSASRPPVPSDDPRRRSMIADAVHTPVAAWCGAGYKAADIASVPADPGPEESEDCQVPFV